MDRGFVPGGFGGFGGFRRPFRPFPHPFFPGRFLFPFFFFSPFFFPFPFFREDGTIADNDMFVAQHQVQAGDSMDKIAHTYNIPKVILEEANPHLTGQGLLPQGEQVHIPRISHMGCQKTYIESMMDAQTANQMLQPTQMQQANQPNPMFQAAQMQQANQMFQPTQMQQANQPNQMFQPTQMQQAKQPKQMQQAQTMPFSGKLY